MPKKILSRPTLSDIATARVEDVLQRRRINRKARRAALAKLIEKIKIDLRILDAGKHIDSTSVESAGYLVASGDSWFDYPFPYDDDILVQLHDHHAYNIESAAHYGARIENMPYQGGQLEKLGRGVDKLHDQGITPKAVLLSGGGNDFAGDEFGMLLNSAASSIKGWNQEILTGLIQERISNAYTVFLLSINQLCTKILGKNIPILIHGYDYPVPDGRGFLGGGFLSGPWLQPGFHEKLFADDQANTENMKVVIDQFNVMLSNLPKTPALGNVHYIDLRGTLSSVLTGKAYKRDWNNELHPTDKGFQAVAARFAAVLATL